MSHSKFISNEKNDSSVPLGTRKEYTTGTTWTATLLIIVDLVSC